jgi:hypothetical protein
MFRLSQFQLARRILLPAILPAYVLALRQGLGLGWMFVVAAEFMGASEGLGYLLVDGQQLGKPDQIRGGDHDFRDPWQNHRWIAGRCKRAFPHLARRLRPQKLNRQGTRHAQHSIGR